MAAKKLTPTEAQLGTLALTQDEFDAKSPEEQKALMDGLVDTEPTPPTTPAPKAAKSKAVEPDALTDAERQEKNIEDAKHEGFERGQAEQDITEAKPSDR